MQHRVEEGSLNTRWFREDDVDGDRGVDIYDIVKICVAYGSETGDPKYDANLDIDGDGDIDIYDVVIACGNYGKKDP